MFHGPRVTLTVTAGSQRGRTITIPNHQIVILGRCPKNDIPVEDEFASWHHLLFEVNPPWVCLRDLGSLNGVYVNRVRVGGGLGTGDHDSHPVSGGVRLRNGDVVAAGMTGIVVGIDPPGPAHTKRVRLPEFPEIPGYRLQQLLTNNVTGRTFRATRESDRLQAIVRILNPTQRIRPAHVACVLDNLRALQALQFPHIARIHDVGIHEGWCWVATKFKTGDSGKLARARGGRLPWELLVPILLQALKGLAHAHNMGFVHHDLRPSSILIRKEKQARFVQIRDIGLAHLIEQYGLQPFLFTGEGARDLEFAPRERLTRFRKVLPASDVWSMAACAYYLLTGSTPREAVSGDDPVCRLLESDAVPIAERPGDVPKPLAEVIDTALAFDPSARFCDAEGFRDALKIVARDLDVKSGEPDSE